MCYLVDTGSCLFLVSCAASYLVVFLTGSRLVSGFGLFSVFSPDFSVLLEFASTTMLACALSFVQLSTVRDWFFQHFPRGGRSEKLIILYRITLFSYGLRMLALFLYDSFLVAREINRQSEFREIDSVLLALDVGYRGSLTIFFFRKFFEFENIPEVFETTNSSKSKSVEPNECQSKAEGQQIETYGDNFKNPGAIVARGKSAKELECCTPI